MRTWYSMLNFFRLAKTMVKGRPRQAL